MLCLLGMATIRVERPSLCEIQRAAEVVRPVTVHTPLVPIHTHGKPLDLLLKPEVHQVVGSFKIRGVFNAVWRLDEDQRRRGISTVSAGNTAQALAWTGHHFGVPARSIMPEDAVQSKIDAVRAYGGQPVLVPTEEVFRYLREHLWESEPEAFIHPWIDRDVIVGHGSMGLEIIAACPEVDSVYVPVGGGGLMGGVGSALKALKPSLHLVAVEPQGCPSLHESILADRPVTVSCRTICDGVAVPYITDQMYPLLRELVDETVLVSEEQVKTTIKRLALEDNMIVEGSGALAAAAALATPRSERGLSVCLVTGGSIDLAKLIPILTG